MSKEKKQLPLKPGLFVIPDDPNEKPYLEGQRCTACGTHFNYKRWSCENCGSESMETVALSGRGKLNTYTIIHKQLPGALVTVPYAIGVLEMEEGIFLRSVIDKDFENLKVGMPLEIYFDVMAEDKEGNELLSYKFRAA
ncbi:MAG: OB-fold domain-containing protein [Desulfobacterales bacterium]